MTDNSNRVIRILHLEDNPRDAELISDLLNNDGLRAEITLAINRETYEYEIEHGTFDIILCDYNLPDYNGASALEHALTNKPNVPVIILSGSLGEEEAVRCLHLGAKDYLLKHRLERLTSAVQRALQESEALAKKREAEEALHAMNANLERALKYQELFIANMTHEIRTPLNIILGYSGLISNVMEDRIQEDEREYFQSIETAGKRLMRTVDNILQITSIQTGFVHLKPKKRNIVPLVRSVVHELQGYAAEKKLTLREYFNEESIYAVIDQYSFEQALMNLIDNAIKYTRQGEINVVVSRNAIHTHVEVRDTGIGISEEFLPHLFEAFTQEDTGYTRSYQGLGLGLSLVKKYITMNGGTISVQSKKGEGSVFRIELPISE